MRTSRQASLRVQVPVMATEAVQREDKWGVWSFDPATLGLVLSEGMFPPYRVELSKITSSACMLDVIFDLKDKQWATNDVIGDLIMAFQALFDPQMTLCGQNRGKTFDPVAYLSHTVH